LGKNLVACLPRSWNRLRYHQRPSVHHDEPWGSRGTESGRRGDQGLFLSYVILEPPCLRTLKRHFADDAVPTLQTFLKQPQEARVFRCAQAVRDVVQGQRLPTVSDTRHVPAAALRKWVDRFAHQGTQGLVDRPRSGRPPHRTTCSRPRCPRLGRGRPRRARLPGPPGRAHCARARRTQPRACCPASGGLVAPRPAGSPPSLPPAPASEETGGIPATPGLGAVLRVEPSDERRVAQGPWSGRVWHLARLR